MMQPVQREILNRLAEICDLSEDVRFGQMIDFLAFLAQDANRHSLAEIEDEVLLSIIERHRADLARRQTPVAQPRS